MTNFQGQFVLVVLFVVGFFYVLDHTLFHNRDYEAYISDLESVYKPILGKKEHHQPSFNEKYHDTMVTLGKMDVEKTDQTDPELIALIRDLWLFPPSKRLYKLDNEDKSDFSMGQSEMVDKALKNMEGGFFVECGALDGETRSNSLFFERDRYWSGLLIEASLLNFHNLLKRRRKAYAIPACLGVKTHPEKLMFNEAVNRGRLIEGKRGIDWVFQQGIASVLGPVQCFPLYSMLMTLNQTRVDYFSLDVEGLELEVLRTIPWKKVDIRVISVEFTHVPEGKDALREFVEQKGYTLIGEVTAPKKWANDFVFMKNGVT